MGEDFFFFFFVTPYWGPSSRRVVWDTICIIKWSWSRHRLTCYTCTCLGPAFHITFLDFTLSCVLERGDMEMLSQLEPEDMCVRCSNHRTTYNPLYMSVTWPLHILSENVLSVSNTLRFRFARFLFITSSWSFRTVTNVRATRTQTFEKIAFEG